MTIISLMASLLNLNTRALGVVRPHSMNHITVVLMVGSLCIHVELCQNQSTKMVRFFVHGSGLRQIQLYRGSLYLKYKDMKMNSTHVFAILFATLAPVTFANDDD